MTMTRTPEREPEAESDQDQTYPASSPAAQLSGLTIEGVWKIGELIKRTSCQTGGNFSCCYQVSHKSTGRKAFLKALDYSVAFQQQDVAAALLDLTSAYIFERDLLLKCKQMSRVVQAIGHGKIGTGPLSTVEYLLFELADGDIRTHLAMADRLDLAWKLRSLHHLATGLRQLHTAGIAHQDVKPSNVLVFEGRVAKVADLGRAAAQGLRPPHDKLDVQGDRGYAPPELLYRYLDPDWDARRIGCDIYLLGSMIFFLFTGSSATALLLDGVPPTQHWTQWKRSYQEVLPHLLEAFGPALDDLAAQAPPAFRDELVGIARELCHPDPARRGDRSSGFRHANPFSLERYVSRFDLMAKRARRSR